ncbi:hypothetical protein, partial [Escherichia coli]|uniref:hypothetical protein n=1 Tax=Escherichia coli TaxID=562 RepID=UPI001C5A1D66
RQSLTASEYAITVAICGQGVIHIQWSASHDWGPNNTKSFLFSARLTISILLQSIELNSPEHFLDASKA